MKEPRINGFEDEDFRTVLAELDVLDAEAEQIMASAKGKVSAIRKRQKNRIKIADKELSIPPDLLRTIRAQRRLEHKLQALADDIPKDMIELYEDSSGQFSIFAPEDGEEVVDAPAATKAARKAKTAAQANAEAEQEEGDKVLDELVQ